MVQTQLLQSFWPPVKTTYKDHHGFYYAIHLLYTAKNSLLPICAGWSPQGESCPLRAVSEPA